MLPKLLPRKLQFFCFADEQNRNWILDLDSKTTPFSASFNNYAEMGVAYETMAQRRGNVCIAVKPQIFAELWISNVG